MKAFVFIDNTQIGEADLKITDESMGGIGGMLRPLPGYNNYRQQIQQLFHQKGIANVSDFNFSIVLEGGVQVEAEGGIGVSDSREYPDEIYVESAGVRADILEMIAAAGSL
ncbi:MAG TPA: hypothetical protein VGO45_03875 [Bacteroidia bacterium]|jgi:hypothetical protein|nr:hypothetical protein [Bacteroidia bacterium]